MKRKILFFSMVCYCCTFVLEVEAQQKKRQQQQKTNQPQTAISLDGKWTGKTGQDKIITFTVLNNRITEFSVEGRFEGYGCSTTSSTTTTINQLIVNKSFSFGVRGGPGGISLSISGTFTSSTEAQGSAFMQLHPIPGPPPGVPGHIPSCGGTMETTWKATKGAIPVDTSLTTGEPAPAPSSPHDSSISRSATSSLPAPEPSPTPAAIPKPISIVQEFSAPGWSTEGITSDGTYLWLSDNSGTIFKIDTSGKALGNFASPDVTPQGMTWDGSSFYIFTTNKLSIYRFRIAGQNAKKLKSFRSPAKVFGGGISHDMAWDGKSLWYANQFNVYRLDNSGKILSSFTAPKNVTGLDWDGSYLWLAYDGVFSNTLIMANTSGESIGTFPSPISEINGLAWANGYLWAIGRDSVYKLDVSVAKSTIVPSSK